MMADKRPICYLYVDELQNFGGVVFDNVRSESRKYATPLVLGHQILTQTSKRTHVSDGGHLGNVRLSGKPSVQHNSSKNPKPGEMRGMSL